MEQHNADNSKGYQVKAERIDQVGDRFELRGSQEILVAGVCDLPPKLGDRWVAREGTQAKLQDYLSRQPLTELVAAGGFGKSLLAAWIFRQQKDAYDKRLWVNFRQDRWQQAFSFERFARGVLQEIERPLKDLQASEDRLLSELCLRLDDPNRSQKTLIVLDNWESLRSATDWPWFQQFLKMWVEKGDRSRILTTTRPDAVTAYGLLLEGLTLAEGTVFLQQQALGGNRVEALIQITLGHPLLLGLAATWVRSTANAVVDERAIAFFRHLFEQRPDLARSLSADQLEDAVAIVFEEVFAALLLPVREGLQRVSVYRIPFGLEMAQAMVPELTAGDLQGLAQQALLIAEEERFTLHPLIAERVRKLLTEGMQAQAHEQALSYYQAHYQRWDGTIESCQEELEAFYHACALEAYAVADKILDRCVDMLNTAGYWREILPLYQQLAEQWQPASGTEDSQSLVWVWTRLGSLFWSLGNYQEAIAAHKKAGVLAKSCHFPEGQAASLNNLGNAYYSLGQYTQAIEFHQQSLAIQQDIGNRSGEADSLNNLGSAYHSLGQHTQAIDFHQQSLAIKQDIGNRSGEANSLGNLGNAYYSLGQYTQAIDFYQQSLAIKQNIGDRSGEAALLNGLGNAYDSLGQYTQAIDFHQQSLAIKQNIGNRSGEALSHWNLNLCSRRRGRLKRAMHHRHQAYRLWQEIQLPVAAAPLPNLQKKLCQQMGDSWAQELLENERKLGWLFLPFGYVAFAVRKSLSPFTALQKALRLDPRLFWFAVGILLVALIAWLK